MVVPAWSAVTAQLPADRIDTVAPFVPLVVQTAGVVLAKETGLPLAPPVALSVSVLFGAVA